MTRHTRARTILDNDRRPRFGWFSAPLSEVDLGRARVRSIAPASLRLKQWQHFAVWTDDVALTLAAVDAGFMRLAWVQVVDRRAPGSAVEHSARGLLAGRIARSLWDEVTELRSRSVSIVIHNHLDAREHRVAVRAGRGSERVIADLTLRSTEAPLVVCLPVGRGRAMYSHKAPLTAEGVLTVGGRSTAVRGGLALVDVHKAHYPHHTWWRWATGAGRGGSGEILAFNLTHNVVQNDREWNENALWSGAAPIPLSPARFEVPRSNPEARPWRVWTEDGEAELVFTPAGARREHLRLGVVRSRFHQCYGTWNGRIRAGGHDVEVREWFGLAEDHDALW